MGPLDPGAELFWSLSVSSIDLEVMIDWDWLEECESRCRWKFWSVSVVELTTFEATDWALERRLEAAAETLEATLAAAWRELVLWFVRPMLEEELTIGV